MNYDFIKHSIQHDKVDTYISYLKKLEAAKDKSGRIVNWWFDKQEPQVFIELWNKCLQIGLPIDGDTVTINARGGVPALSFDYHAYRNIVLIKYPETVFDQQLVYSGDTFSFSKENGKVLYKHEISNPFDKDKQIIGAYAVIKNNTGEFIEFVHMEDIAKMKKTSNSSNIWETWFDRMVLKSVIKRICNVNFKDITKAMDTIDNEEYDLNKIELTDYDLKVYEAIEQAQSQDQLTTIYNENKGLVKDQKALIVKLSARKEQILKGNGKNI